LALLIVPLQQSRPSVSKSVAYVARCATTKDLHISRLCVSRRSTAIGP